MPQAWEISPQDLKAELTKVTLVDVREPEEFAEDRIDGTKLIHIPLGELQERAGEIDRADDLVVYCAHGVRSVQGMMLLKQLGFEKVRSLEGGIVGYRES